MIQFSDGGAASILSASALFLHLPRMSACMLVSLQVFLGGGVGGGGDWDV